MDFAFTEEQKALSDVAGRIFKEHATHEALRRAEQAHAGTLPELWHALADSELLGVALSSDVGGGLGLVELCLLLEQQGWHAAQVPLLWTSLAALAVDRHGSVAQRAELSRVTSGERVLTCALLQTADGVRAQRHDDGWRVSGVCDCVPAASIADRVVVPARTESGGTIVVLVDPRGVGATFEAQVGTSEEPLGRVTLVDAPGEALGDEARADELVGFLMDRVQLGLCALELGLVQGALRMTARYASERKQFDRAIGTFQAVAQRAGDAYVDVETIRLATWRAVWLLENGRPAAREIAVARYWAAEAGHRVVNAAQHIHGGLGFDRDYPLYRHFLMSKQIEFTLGSASAQLARLGAMLAAAE